MSEATGSFDIAVFPFEQFQPSPGPMAGCDGGDEHLHDPPPLLATQHEAQQYEHAAEAEHHTHGGIFVDSRLALVGREPGGVGAAEQ
jgi:hypothetical protein